MKNLIFLFTFTMFISCNGDDDSSCSSAAAASTTALTNFTNNNSDANCVALKAALENQRDVCGSLSSSLAGTLADLSCD